jgi:hypothetical protein
VARVVSAAAIEDTTLAVMRIGSDSVESVRNIALPGGLSPSGIAFAEGGSSLLWAQLSGDGAGYDVRALVDEAAPLCDGRMPAPVAFIPFELSPFAVGYGGDAFLAAAVDEEIHLVALRSEPAEVVLVRLGRCALAD